MYVSALTAGRYVRNKKPKHIFSINLYALQGEIMPMFPDPFAGNSSKKMTDRELAQAIRLDIASELEAIFLYDAHAAATDNPVAKAVLEEIRDEEKAHFGELVTLMRYLDPQEAELFESGAAEVREVIEELEEEGLVKK